MPRIHGGSSARVVEAALVSASAGLGLPLPGAVRLGAVVRRDADCRSDLVGRTDAYTTMDPKVGSPWWGPFEAELVPSNVLRLEITAGC